MRYLPHTETDITAMLATLPGVDTLEDLFSSIPPDCRSETPLSVPGPLTEWELRSHMETMAADMASEGTRLFVGAGRYDHYIPSTLPYLLSRSEFSTAYTPYQPEVSQGTLQAIFEYQTLCSRLLKMDVVTASHYDGATALAEALIMAIRKTKQQKVAVSRAVHPLYRDVVKTYLRPMGCEIVELPYGPDGRTVLEESPLVEGVAAIAVQSPNFFGVIEHLGRVSDFARSRGAVSIMGFTEALSLGMLEAPGALGIDIVAGEGQSLGIPRSFGGPGLGIMGSTAAFMRQLPGRLVGLTTDRNGKRGFVLTLATREQHIRREKATSNICSNNGLCALNAAMYMASLGGSGFRELARLNFNKAEYLKRALKSAAVDLPLTGPTFNEFLVNFGERFDSTYAKLVSKGIVAGIPVATWYPELTGHYLLCVTETCSRAEMDSLVKEVCA